MIVFPILSILFAIATVLLLRKAKRLYQDFVSTYSKDAVFVLSIDFPEELCAVISMAYWVLIIILYPTIRYSDKPYVYFYFYIFCVFGGVACILYMLHAAAWCVIGHKERIVYHSFREGVRVIAAEDLRDYHEKEQRKYKITGGDNASVTINSPSVKLRMLSEDGEPIEMPLYSADLVYDNNPITNLMDAWGKRG